MRRVTTKIAIATTLALTATLPALQAQAASPGVNDGGVYPSAVPAKFTPNIGSGAVEAIVQVGSRMIVGGSFSTTVTPTAGTGAGTAVTRKYLFAFNASTGQLDTGFVPSVNGEVDSIVPSADGTAVYVGGKFTSAGGVSTRLAEFNLTNGARIATFKPSLNGQIRDMALLGSRLLVAGTFTSVNSATHGGLVSVNAGTGATDPYLSINVSGHHNFGRVPNAAQAPVAASQIAVSPDQTRAIVDGNFISVSDGVGTYARDQIMSINLGASSATVDANWNSNAYTSPCFSNSYDDYVRDVGWSPDGSYFVVSATGGYNGGSFQNCDSASRFDASSSGSNVQPAWIDWTGTDSLYSVAVTSDAVFVGGHQRWLNNPYGQDSPKNGAVPRPGLAALDPANGVPLSWNPGRNPRGHGAEVIYASASGIWVGSDTDFIGPNQYKRQKLAFFPFAGGTPAAGDNTGDPHTVFLAGASGNSFTANSFDPSTGAGGPTSSPSNGGGIAWGSVTGAFVLNGRIWYATGGNFYYRTWDGANAFGAAQLVDPYHDPMWDTFQTGSGQTYQSVTPTFYGELPKVTGMFYANRSIYYTLTGSNKLFKRTFSPDTRASSVANQVTGGVIGPVETTVVSNGNPVDFTLASGMFVANGFLWYATKLDGKLHKAPWNGTTVTGPSTIDTLATGNWAAPGVFVSPTAVVNGPPTANFTASCTALSCSFDASSSTAPGDTISSYTWDFGDQTPTGSGQTTSHLYGSANTYNVTLTINTGKGNTAQTSKMVTVSNVVSPGIAFVNESNTNGNAPSETLTVPGNVAAGNALVLVATGATGGPLTAPAGWTLIGTSSAGTSVTTAAWSKVATASDPGTSVSVGFGAIVHGTVQLLAYSGTNATAPIAAAQSKATQVTGTSYATPTTNVPANGDVVISVWSAKSSAVTGWTTPAGQTVRSVANGSGGGRVNSVATDAVANAGPTGGLTATTTGSAGAFAAWTIVLGP